jgi:hypothetical protein
MVCNFGTGDRWSLGPEVITTSFSGRLNEETTTKCTPRLVDRKSFCCRPEITTLRILQAKKNNG